MENYYEILHCKPESTVEELKNAYQALVLKHHPDKQKQRDTNYGVSENGDTTLEFIRIKKAWDVLGNEALRKEFDARWQQRCLAQRSWPVQDEVEFEDFDELQVGKEMRYTHSCRCGGEYVLTQTDADFKMDYVNCAYCSLCVQVIYPPEDENCSVSCDDRSAEK